MKTIELISYTILLFAFQVSLVVMIFGQSGFSGCPIRCWCSAPNSLEDARYHRRHVVKFGVAPAPNGWSCSQDAQHETLKLIYLLRQVLVCFLFLHTFSWLIS